MVSKGFFRNIIAILIAMVALLIGFPLGYADTQSFIDQDGSITGVRHATYYKVTTWQEMFSAYRSAPDNQMVYLSVEKDIAGSPDFAGGNGRMIAGKGVDILGNGHKIFVDNDTNYTSGTARSGGGQGFFSSDASVTGNTEMTVENATIINNHADGIFAITGNATATTIYKNIHTVNGALTNGAGPIRNENGTIKFMGNNVFNILQGQSMVDLGSGSKIDMSQTKANNSGADNNGEWIQGGQNVEVVDGNTTVNQSWGMDQPFYTYYTKNGSNFSVDANAKLNWNLNETYTMWYDDGNANGPLNWNLGEGSQFIVNGTKNTAIHNNNWFMWMNTLNALNINMASHALLDITSGGGSINLDGFQSGKTMINMAKDSSLNLYNLNTSTSLFSGVPVSGSEINLNDPADVTMKTAGGSVFQNGCNIPINIKGNGLRLHASTNTAAEQDNDLYKRLTTGSTNGNFTSAQMSPTAYSADDLKFLQKARYIQWAQPNGNHLIDGNLNRTFVFNVQDCPQSGLGGLASEGGYFVGPSDNDMHFTFCADEGTSPNVKIQVSLANNLLPHQTAYYWRSAGENDVTTLSTTPDTILSVTSDDHLPEGVTMKDAGEEYDVTFKKDEALLLKAGNGIPTQHLDGAQASFTYSMVVAQ
ncbi:MAG: hypothetical protein ABF709_06360 [Leuconostoc pseudomesenteroides]|uniref:hypothetical protein n=1 Tax=Leuconostoc pseudomesenteroides TaxID=33968 RepID=UPI001E397495|nr:hypothetical protein [Leuconostoc pseudomesenteroides]